MNARDDSGSFIWGIKESFRDYLEMLPDSRIETSYGATVTADGMFAFPLEHAVDAEEGTTLQFGGSVTVTAHGGELSVVVSRPQVMLTAASGRLRMPERDVDVALLGEVTPSGGIITAGCELSAEGAAWLLAGYYQEGDLLDQITITVPDSDDTHGITAAE